MLKYEKLNKRLDTRPGIIVVWFCSELVAPAGQPCRYA